MLWFDSKEKQSKESRKDWNSTYYLKNRDKILEKRHEKYKETGK